MTRLTPPPFPLDTLLAPAMWHCHIFPSSSLLFAGLSFFLQPLAALLPQALCSAHTRHSPWVSHPPPLALVTTSVHVTHTDLSPAQISPQAVDLSRYCQPRIVLDAGDRAMGLSEGKFWEGVGVRQAERSRKYQIR